MKQNVMKRTLAGVLAVLTVAAYMPANVGGFLTESTGIVMGVSAEEATSVSTAEELKNAVEAGGAVQLTANIDLTKTLNVTKDVTIDLKGHNITATDTRAFHVKSGTLTLTGNGTVSSMHTDDNTSFNSSSSVIRVGDGTSETGTNSIEAKLTINKDVTVSSNWCYGVSVFGTDTVETVNIYGKIIVNGEQSALSGLGTKYYGSTTINLYPGSVIKSQNDVAIYHPQAGNMNVDGSTIEGLGGIEAKSGTIEISGDTVVTATGKEIHDANGDGTSTKGYAIAAVKNDKGYQGGAHFIINGGTFTGKVAVAKDNDDPYFAEPIIGISGGTFNNILDSSYVAADHAQDVEYVFDKDSTITLDENTTCGNITVANGVDATIDLDGKTLTVNGRIFVGTQAKAGATQANGSSLVISGGDVNTTRGVKVAYYGNFRVNADATLTSSATQALWYLGYNTIDIYGKVTTTATSADAAVSGIGNKVTSTADDSYNAVVNVYAGGEVSSQVTKGIYMPNDGTLNVYGGTISGTTGIYAKSGNLNISGGTINATGAKVDYSPNNNGGNATGDALVIEASGSGYAQAPAASITGGSFNSANAKSVATYKATGSPYELPTGFITGGTFSTDVSAYVADGYYLIDNNPNYTVKKDERVDLSKAKIVVNGGKAYSIGSTTINVIDDIKVTIGDEELVKDEDYRIYEGDTSANDVGTYVFKIEGLGNYKGTATANWTITSALEITVYGYKSDTSAYYKPCQYGKSVTVTPPEGFVWDKTCYWEVETGVNQWEIVSYSQNYSFIALKNATLRINKSAEEASEKSALTMSTSQAKYSGKDAIKFTFNRSIDDKYTVKEVGILYGTNKLVGANTSISDYAYRDFTNNDTGVEYGVPDLAEALKTRSTVKKGVASSKSKNGTYEFSYALGTNHLAYANAIGYVKVYDPSTKKDKILYTNVVADCYDSALYSNN